MKCSEVERVLSEVLDGASDGTLPIDVDAHVKSCPDCSDLVSDLKLITSEARQLAATEEPAPRVWVRIAAELRAEGLIHDSTIGDSAIRDSESAPARPVIIPVPVPVSPRWRWSALWLAPVAAALLAAGAYMIAHKPAPQVAQQQAPAPVVTSPAQATPSAKAAPVPAPAPQQAPQEVARKSAKPTVPAGPAVEAAVEPGPSAEDQQFLSVVSTLGPSTRATYENQLKAVNADIQETQAYVNRNPRDIDARQHLMDAYQQKALLYQIALDRIQ